MVTVGSSTDKRRHGFYGIGMADGVRYFQLFNTGKGNNIAGARFLNFNTIQTMKTVNLQHTTFTLNAFPINDNQRHVGLYGAALNPADTDNAGVSVVIQAGTPAFGKGRLYQRAAG